MSPQVFRAKTREDAIRLAKEALGQNIAIVSARRVLARGAAGLFGGADIEVTATVAAPTIGRTLVSEPRLPFAADAYASEPQPSQSAIDLAKMQSEIRTLRAQVTRSPKETSSSRNEKSELAHEVAQVRAMIENIAHPEEKNAKGKKAATKLVADLGIEGGAARRLNRAMKGAVATTPTELREVTRDHLADLMPVTHFPLTSKGVGRPRMLIAFVGPSGVGKTTTAAKLAARAVIEENLSVTIISCDGYRVGAYEQMHRFSELIDVPFVMVTSQDELIRAINAADTDIVLVDTAGRSPSETDGVERALAQSRDNRERHVLLCLPANVRAVDAESFARGYRSIAPTALVITKIDETQVPSGMVHAAHATGLPISILCNGPRVPEDMAPATTGAMLDHLLPVKERRSRSAA